MESPSVRFERLKSTLQELSEQKIMLRRLSEEISNQQKIFDGLTSKESALEIKLDDLKLRLGDLQKLVNRGYDDQNLDEQIAKAENKVQKNYQSLYGLSFPKYKKVLEKEKEQKLERGPFLANTKILFVSIIVVSLWASLASSGYANLTTPYPWACDNGEEISILNVDDDVEDCADGSDEDDEGFWSTSDSEQARIDYSNYKFFLLLGIIILSLVIVVFLIGYAGMLHSDKYKEEKYQLEIDKKLAKVDEIRVFYEEQYEILQYKLTEKSNILKEYSTVETLLEERLEISVEKEKIGVQIAETAEKISNVLQIGEENLESIVDMIPDDFRQMHGS